MNGVFNRILITASTVLLITTTLLMVVVTSPHLLVGFEPTEPIVLSVKTDSETDGLINLNTATADDLMSLPNLGELLAERILTYRQQNGVFNGINDLLNVKGVGESRLAQWAEYLTVE